MKNLLTFAKTIIGASSFAVLPYASGAPVSIVIDEWSSTYSTITINGTTLTAPLLAGFPDNWRVTGLDSYGIIIPTATQEHDNLFTIGWAEPGTSIGESSVNALSNVSYGAGGILATLGWASDDSNFASILANGAVYTDPNDHSFSIQFNDHGDTAAIPDGSATVALLGSGMTGLYALRRRFARA